jgi:NAD(P)-dependent dehydrogenase (short-subunit alcohol dehydrogenase family)
MDLGLNGKKVIMSGGSHGIGLEILKIMTAEGADVAFLSRDQGRIDAVDQRIIDLEIADHIDAHGGHALGATVAHQRPQ